ncbi:MAG: hypothetical protein ACRCZM_04465 [Bacteroidales bacterium]
MEANHIVQERYHSRLFFPLFILGSILGVVLYDFIGIEWIDELVAFSLLGMFMHGYLKGKIRVIRPLIIVFIISLFYLIYSFNIGSNVPKAIISDYVVQLKPYLAFFSTLLIAPILSAREKQIIRVLCCVIFLYMILVASGGMIDIIHYFSHPSRFATTAVVTSFMFLYASNWSVSSVVQVLILLSIGLPSTRAKFVGFFALMFLFLFWRLFGNRFRFNPKQIFLALAFISITIWFAWDKIDYYFISGAFDHEEAFARPALYMVAVNIFMDYFPFGCGYASYGTYFSEIYYSEIYYAYGLNNFWGLSEDFGSFISDTYYPVLAQFGVVGILIFGYFWFYVFKQIKDVELTKDTLPFTSIVYLGIAFFVVESIADSTFTHNRGMFLLIIMALSISELRQHKVFTDIN